MLFSYNWIQEYLSGKKLKPQQMADLLLQHSFEVEDMEKKGKDWVLDIDILPNRAHDALNHLGIAREIAALSQAKLKAPKRKKIKARKGTLLPLRVSIKASKKVPRYHAIIIEGITITSSPKWLTERLEAVGVNSINNVVDLTNYLMLSLGQPFHAFDFDAIRGNSMTVREAKAREKIDTLDETNLELPSGALVIEDTEGLIDLAGIKGGKESGISKSTKNIVLQAATFHPQAIYDTKKALHYSTQAADIYSYGIDPHLSGEAMEVAASLLEDICGGKIVQTIDMFPKKPAPPCIMLKPDYATKLLGVDLNASQITGILKRIDCKVSPKKDMLQVEPPTRRLDLTTPEDLIEEIGRIFGYENIQPKPVSAYLLAPDANKELMWQERARDALWEAGFTEVYNYSFLSVKRADMLGNAAELVALQNPLSNDYAYLRNDLLPNLLDNVQHNQRKFPHMKIFEIGRIYRKNEKKRGVQEENRLCLAANGEHAFYEAKGALEFLFQRLGLSDVRYQESEGSLENTIWHSKRRADIIVQGKHVGRIGEVSQLMRKNLKLKDRVAAGSLSMDALLEVVAEEKEYQALSKYPSSVRDIALLVPAQTKIVDVLNVMNAAGGRDVADIDLFDIYEGDKIESGQKSLAFHIVYQSEEKTLTGKEVDRMHEKIIKTVEQNPQWQTRK